MSGESTVAGGVTDRAASATTNVARLADGRALGYDELGSADGVPVFIFHSLFGCRLLPAAAEQLAERHNMRLFGIDRPGFGLSDFKPGRRILDWPDDAVELADILGIDEFRVLGISAGTAYVAASCLKTPERIPRAAIACGLTPIDEAGVAHRILPGFVDAGVRRSLTLSRIVHAGLIFGMRKDPQRAIAQLIATLPPSDQPVLERPEISSFIIGGAIESARPGLKGWAWDDRILNEPWGFAPSDLPPTLPIDLWWGEDDTTVPVAHARAFAEVLPNATLHVNPGGGHFGGLFDHMDEIFATLVE